MKTNKVNYIKLELNDIMLMTANTVRKITYCNKTINVNDVAVFMFLKS